MRKLYIDYTLLFIVIILFFVTGILFYRSSKKKNLLENFETIDPICSLEKTINFSIKYTHDQDEIKKNIKIPIDKLIPNPDTGKKYYYKYFSDYLDKDDCHEELGLVYKNDKCIRNNIHISIQEIHIKEIHTKETTENSDNYDYDNTHLFRDEDEKLHFKFTVKIDEELFVNEKNEYQISMDSTLNKVDSVNVNINEDEIIITGYFTEYNELDDIIFYVMYMEKNNIPSLSEGTTPATLLETTPASLSCSYGLGDLSSENDWKSYEAICDEPCKLFGINNENGHGIYLESCTSGEFEHCSNTKLYYSFDQTKLFDAAIKCPHFLYFGVDENGKNYFYDSDSTPQDLSNLKKVNPFFLSSFVNEQQITNLRDDSILAKYLEDNKERNIYLSELEKFDYFFILTKNIVDNGTGLRKINIDKSTLLNNTFFNKTLDDKIYLKSNLEYTPGIILLEVNDIENNNLENQALENFLRQIGIELTDICSDLNNLSYSIDINSNNLILTCGDENPINIDLNCPDNYRLVDEVRGCDDTFCNDKIKCTETPLSYLIGQCGYSYCKKLSDDPLSTSGSIYSENSILRLKNNPSEQDISNGYMDIYRAINEMVKDANSNNYLQTNGVNIKDWDVSEVIIMDRLFSNSYSQYNDTTKTFLLSEQINDIDISNWDVSNVTHMNYMFSGSKFNKDISDWDVSNVEEMEGIFYQASNFNQDIGKWDVSNVLYMNNMFSEAQNFNQDIISNWEVLNNARTYSMFYDATAFLEIFERSSDCISVSEFDGPPSCWFPKSNNNDPLNTSGSIYSENSILRLKNNPSEQDISDGYMDIYRAINEMVKDANSNNYLQTNGVNIKEWDVSEVTDMGFLFSPINDQYNDTTKTFLQSEQINDFYIGYWKTNNVEDMQGMFYNATNFNQNINMKEVTLDNGISYIAWDTFTVKNMSKMFKNATNFNQDIGNWDTTNVENMQEMFNNATNFNQNINAKEVTLNNETYVAWETLSVINMSNMFSNATNFNQDIGKWDTGNVENMEGMFYNAYNFNQNINAKEVTLNNETYVAWDTLKVINMSKMFEGIFDFNQDIGNWNVSNVLYMNSMFRDTHQFNQDISNWNVSQNTDVTNMFQQAEAFLEIFERTQDCSSGTDFDGPPSCWLPKSTNNDPLSTSGSIYSENSILRLKNNPTQQDISNGYMDIYRAINEMVKDANSNNYLQTNGVNIKDWDVSEVIIMNKLFSPINDQYNDTTKTFLQSEQINDIDISNWNVSNVNNMGEMFKGAINFNQDIVTKEVPLNNGTTYYAWNVSNVDDMIEMFAGANNFNQDIGNWDVSNVNDMSYMFSNALNFNQDIGNWDVSNVNNMSFMFSSALNFNQDIGNWDVSNVNNMSYMFSDAANFNKDIGNWDVFNVNDMGSMFSQAFNFNQDIGNWDVSNVDNMNLMFFDANSFNQDISNWNVSQNTNVTNMFQNASDLLANYERNSDNNCSAGGLFDGPPSCWRSKSNNNDQLNSGEIINAEPFLGSRFSEPFLGSRFSEPFLGNMNTNNKIFEPSGVDYSNGAPF